MQLFAGQALDAMLRDLVEHHVETLSGDTARICSSPREKRRAHRLRGNRIALRYYLIDSLSSIATVAISWPHAGDGAKCILGLIGHRRNPAPEIVEPAKCRHPEIHPPKCKTAEMRKPGDARAASDSHSKIDGCKPDHEPSRLHRNDAEDINLFVRPPKRVREQHSHYGSRSSNKDRASIEQHVRYSAANAAPQIEVDECARSPCVLYARSEHPERQHVEREMP